MAGPHPTLRERERDRSRNLRFVLVAVLAAACVGAYLAFGKHDRQGAARPPSERGVHLYLRAAGEPAERATTLDLTSQGDL